MQRFFIRVIAGKTYSSAPKNYLVLPRCENIYENMYLFLKPFTDENVLFPYLPCRMYTLKWTDHITYGNQ